MSKKKKSKPDLTEEFRLEQEALKKNKSQPATNPGSHPSYPTSGSNNGYPFYAGQNNGYPQYGYPSQNPDPSFHHQQVNIPGQPTVSDRGLPAVETPVEETKSNKKLSRVKEYSKKKDVPDVERQYHAQQSRRYFMRSVLIFLNFVLLGFLVYSIIDIVINVKNQNAVTAESYITLCGKSEKESEQIYSELLDGKEAEKINDYAIYGDSFYFSDVRISLDHLSSAQDLYVANVCSTRSESVISKMVSNPIRLTQLSGTSFEDGDYLISTGPQSDKLPIKYSGKNPIDATIYSLPDKDGRRTKITIKNNSASPALVLSKETVDSLPVDYFDLVFYVAEAQKDRVPVLKGLVSKTVFTSVGYPEVYSSKANFAFDLTGTDYVAASVENFEGFTIDNDHSFVREIGGNLTGANSCTDSTGTCVLNPVYQNDHRGKRSFVFDNADTDANILKNLKAIINN